MSGISPALWASIIAWSNAICARPGRRPVSMTRNMRGALTGIAIAVAPGIEGTTSVRGVAGRRHRLLRHDAQLAADLADVAAVGLERIARDVDGRRIAVGTVAGRHVLGDLAGAAGGAERDALVDDVVELARSGCRNRRRVLRRRSASGRRARRGNRSGSGRAARAATGRAAWRAGGPSASPSRGRSRTCGCARPCRPAAGPGTACRARSRPCPR